MYDVLVSMPHISFSQKQIKQSHYIDVAHGAIFIEQNMRFGLVLGQLAILEKNWAVKYGSFEGVFYVFMGENEGEKTKKNLKKIRCKF